MESNDSVNGRRISRRDMLKGLAGSAVVGMLAACAAPQPAPAPAQPADSKPAATAVPPPPSIVEVTWASWIYEPWNNLLSAQVMRYMADHPNVRIVYSPIPYDQLNTKYMTSLASGTPYTIMGIYGPWMPQFLEGNNFDPAPDDIIADMKANVAPALMDASVFDGKIMGYNAAPGTLSPIINTDIYSAAGMKEPDKWSDIIDAVPTFDKKDASGKWTQLTASFAASQSNSNWTVIHYGSLLFPYGGSFLSADNKKAAVNSPQGLEALKLYGQLAHSDAPPGAFANKLAAMNIEGPWQKSAWRSTAPDLKYKALKVLEGPAGRSIPAYSWYWLVSHLSKAESKSAAWEFCKYIAAAPQQAEQYRIVGLLPITKDVPPEFAKDEWLQAFISNVQYAKIYYPPVKDWAKVEVALSEELERFVVGEIKPEVALKNAEDKINAILAG